MGSNTFGLNLTKAGIVNMTNEATDICVKSSNLWAGRIHFIQSDQSDEHKPSMQLIHLFRRAISVSSSLFSLCHVIGLWNPDIEIAFGKLYVSSDNGMLWEKKVTVMHNVLYVSMLVNQTYFYNASYKVHSIKVRLIKELHSLAFCFTAALLNTCWDESGFMITVYAD